MLARLDFMKSIVALINLNFVTDFMISVEILCTNLPTDESHNSEFDKSRTINKYLIVFKHHLTQYMTLPDSLLN